MELLDLLCEQQKSAPRIKVFFTPIKVGKPLTLIQSNLIICRAKEGIDNRVEVIYQG